MLRGEVGRCLAHLLALLLIVAGASTAQVVNLTGTWVLNVEKSRRGKLRPPLMITVTIDHQEPNLAYLGRLVSAEGEEAGEFEFRGAIDGREYPLRRSFAEGTVVLRRVNSRTLDSEFKSHDGLWTEFARTSVSGDGRLMRRSVRRDGPFGRLERTEVYERR